ncbi:MAG: hypothetical protein KAH44_18010, partial [Oricola sp.]|nr:hypothetical protein [Oricola sp.]
RLPLYLAVCLGITVIVYSLILGAVSKLFIITSLSTVLIYQTINFHHYIVDSLIWKVRKPEIRRNIGLGS